MYLLDVNVLIAWMDAGHPHHKLVRRWFAEHHQQGWATCPLTENGAIRIFGHTSYPGGPADTNDARFVLNTLKSMPGHQFWSDSLSLCDSDRIRRLPGSKSITDIYLLALAVERESYFVTLDQRINANLVKGGTEAFELIPAKSP
ncbi:MAG: TA system VapC family ribonuclease toxin [Verrucomicrobiota bacterium]